MADHQIDEKDATHAQTKINEILKKVVDEHKAHPAKFSLSGHIKTGKLA